MKLKILFLSALAFGMAAVVATGNLPNNYKSAGAYSAQDEYTSTSDHFLMTTDGNSALKSAYNGGSSDSTRADDVTISSLGSTSSISWKISVAKYSYDTYKNLKMGNSSKTIKNHASDSDFAAIYTAISSVEDFAETHYVSAMYSTTTISAVKDIFLAWNAISGNLVESTAGNFYFLYKLSGGTWTVIHRNESTYAYDGIYGTDDDHIASNVWNRHIAFVSEEMIAANDPTLHGQNAQIAVAYDAGTSSSKNFVCIDALTVNKVESAKATMHYWSKRWSETCSMKKTDNNYIKLYMLAYRFSQTNANDLNVAATFEGAAKETNYYAQFAYICENNSIVLSYTPAQSVVTHVIFESNKSYLFLIAAASLTVGILGIALLAFKKKHN